MYLSLRKIGPSFGQQDSWNRYQRDVVVAWRGELLGPYQLPQILPDKYQEIVDLFSFNQIMQIYHQ